MKDSLVSIQPRQWPQTVIVEPSRLAMGIWGQSEGDIAAAYCVDTFPKIKTFSHVGHLFASLGGLAEESIRGYPLILPQDYNGLKPRKYTYEGRAPYL